MSTKQYIEELQKLNCQEMLTVIKSLQEGLINETDHHKIHPAIIDLILVRQKDLHNAMAGAKPYDQLKNEIAHKAGSN